MRYALLSACLVACGGAATPQSVNVPQTTPTASATTTAPPPEAPAVSVVHFDDLGITFAVPSGFHVIGDKELVARVEASASPHLQSDLRSHAAANKALPLLAISNNDLAVTLSVAVVPADATPMELVSAQKSTMAANLAGFAATGEPQELVLDEVKGAEIRSRFSIEKRQVASRMRLYVRNGIETLVTVVWTESSPGGADAAESVLRGLHFLPIH